MRLLLHACCAPCSVKCVQALRDEGIEPVLFWFNPNIHPYTEYMSRRQALIDYATKVGAELVTKGGYGLRSFVEGTIDDIDNRCEYCYTTRLYAAAEYAKQNGFDAICTTLLISPYQNHDMIKKIGESAAASRSINFLYRDFRPYFRLGQREAREMGLYMQKYCGCIFSEEERYGGGL